MSEQIIEAMGKLNSDIIEADDICHDSVQFVVDGLGDDFPLFAIILCDDICESGTCVGGECVYNFFDPQCHGTGLPRRGKGSLGQFPPPTVSEHTGVVMGIPEKAGKGRPGHGTVRFIHD